MLVMLMTIHADLVTLIWRHFHSSVVIASNHIIECCGKKDSGLLVLLDGKTASDTMPAHPAQVPRQDPLVRTSTYTSLAPGVQRQKPRELKTSPEKTGRSHTNYVSIPRSSQSHTQTIECLKKATQKPRKPQRALIAEQAEFKFNAELL